MMKNTIPTVLKRNSGNVGRKTRFNGESDSVVSGSFLLRSGTFENPTHSKKRQGANLPFFVLTPRSLSGIVEAWMNMMMM